MDQMPRSPNGNGRGRSLDIHRELAQEWRELGDLLETTKLGAAPDKVSN
jgi:hypothetical protein